jgi:hypothetical protein
VKKVVKLGVSTGLSEVVVTITVTGVADSAGFVGLWVTTDVRSSVVASVETCAGVVVSVTICAGVVASVKDCSDSTMGIFVRVYCHAILSWRKGVYHIRARGMRATSKAWTGLETFEPASRTWDREMVVRLQDIYADHLDCNRSCRLGFFLHMQHVMRA